MVENYSEDSIRTLDWQEHIRLRPGMYIGKLGDGSAPDDGIYILVKEVLEILKSMSPHPIERLHVIGGGSRNDLLNQLTANAIGIPVLAGPSEATAIGNCLIQAKSAGLLTDCWEMRRLIATAFPPKEFYPER